MNDLFFLEIKKKKELPKAKIVYIEKNNIENNKETVTDNISNFNLSKINIEIIKDIDKKTVKETAIDIEKNKQIDEKFSKKINEQRDEKIDVEIENETPLDIVKIPIYDDIFLNSDEEYLGIIPMHTKKFDMDSTLLYEYYLESYHLLIKKNTILIENIDLSILTEIGYKKYIRKIIKNRWNLEKNNISLVKFFRNIKNIHIYIVYVNNVNDMKIYPNDLNINDLYLDFYWKIINNLKPYDEKKKNSIQKGSHLILNDLFTIDMADLIMFQSEIVKS